VTVCGSRLAVMVVTNCHRTTAIVIRNDGRNVVLVPMSAGKLAAETLSFSDFRLQWEEADYALERALATFLHLAAEHGATSEVKRGLVRLQQRDSLIPSLF
jgi:hypothetical protein